MSKILLIYTTTASLQEAEKITNELLNKKYIACSNSFPISSSCWWNSSIESFQEVALVLKSVLDRKAQIYDALITLHSYKTPCILSWEVDAEGSYFEWIVQTCGGF